MDLVAQQHVGSSRTRDGTCVPCIGRLILNHWSTREAQILTFECKSFLILHEEMGIMHKAFLLQTEVKWLLQGKVFVLFFEFQTELVFFFLILFLLERTDYSDWLFGRNFLKS